MRTWLVEGGITPSRPGNTTPLDTSYTVGSSMHPGAFSHGFLNVSKMSDFEMKSSRADEVAPVRPWLLPLASVSTCIGLSEVRVIFLTHPPPWLARILMAH